MKTYLENLGEVKFPKPVKNVNAIKKMHPQHMDVMFSIEYDIAQLIQEEVGQWFFTDDDTNAKAEYFLFVPGVEKVEWYETLEALEKNLPDCPYISFKITPCDDTFRGWVYDTCAETTSHDDEGIWDAFLADNQIGDECNLLDNYSDDFRESLWEALMDLGMDQEKWGKENPEIYKFYTQLMAG